jgi:hypothetical protein
VGTSRRDNSRLLPNLMSAPRCRACKFYLHQGEEMDCKGCLNQANILRIPYDMLLDLTEAEYKYTLVKQVDPLFLQWSLSMTGDYEGIESSRRAREELAYIRGRYGLGPVQPTFVWKGKRDRVTNAPIAPRGATDK